MKRHNVFEDIWMNTQEPAPAEQSDPDWEEIEQNNALINPDPESMDDRG